MAQFNYPGHCDNCGTKIDEQLNGDNTYCGRCSAFALGNDPPAPRKGPPLVAPPPGKQLSMFGGLDRPAGTQDLFDVDGASKLPTEEPATLHDLNDGDAPAGWAEMISQIMDGAAHSDGDRITFPAHAFAALFDEPTARLAWCQHCGKFTEQTADLLPFRCDECGQEP